MDVDIDLSTAGGYYFGANIELLYDGIKYGENELGWLPGLQEQGAEVLCYLSREVL